VGALPPRRSASRGGAACAERRVRRALVALGVLNGAAGDGETPRPCGKPDAPELRPIRTPGSRVRESRVGRGPGSGAAACGRGWWRRRGTATARCSCRAGRWRSRRPENAPARAAARAPRARTVSQRDESTQRACEHRASSPAGLSRVKRSAAAGARPRWRDRSRGIGRTRPRASSHCSRGKRPAPCSQLGRRADADEARVPARQARIGDRRDRGAVRVRTAAPRSLRISYS